MKACEVLLVLTALLFFATVFVIPAYAKSTDTVWCMLSVSKFDEWDRYERGIVNVTKTPDDANCVCYPTDYLYEGQWQDLYCLGNGKLKQARTVKVMIKPACSDWQWATEERELDAEFCKKCPDPNILSGWELAGCENNTKIYKRKIEAYFFNPTLDDCFKQNYVEYKFEKVASCEGIKTEPSIWYKMKNEKGEKIMPQPEPEGFPLPSTSVLVILFALFVFAYLLYKGGKTWHFSKKRRA